MTKLSVVILNWNAAEDTASCLRSVRAWEATGLAGRPTICVVDNGSRPPGNRTDSAGVPRISAGILSVCGWRSSGLANAPVVSRSARPDHGGYDVSFGLNDMRCRPSSVTATT